MKKVTFVRQTKVTFSMKISPYCNMNGSYFDVPKRLERHFGNWCEAMCESVKEDLCPAKADGVELPENTPAIAPCEIHLPTQILFLQ